MQMVRCFIVCLAFVAPALLRADSSFRKTSILPVPTLGYTPETRAYAGAVVQLAYRPDSLARISSAKIDISFTRNRQRILLAECDWFLKDEKAVLKTQLLHTFYPDYYWGIGAGASDLQRLRYSGQRSSVQFAWLLRLKPKLFSGPDFRFHQQRNFSFLEGDTALFNTLAPGRVVGVGWTYLSDHRDNQLNASSGRMFRLQMGINRWTGGNYPKLQLDYRNYFPISKGALAFRGFYQHSGKLTPFFDLPVYGGDAARGYFLGRFRGQNLVLLQMEIRRTVYRRWGLAAFGGAGNSITRTESMIQLIKPNVGLGVRFLADRAARVNLRLDYAWGAKGQSGFYIAFGEAF
jgi:hypothetical protein